MAQLYSVPWTYHRPKPVGQGAPLPPVPPALLGGTPRLPLGIESAVVDQASVGVSQWRAQIGVPLANLGQGVRYNLQVDPYALQTGYGVATAAQTLALVVQQSAVDPKLHAERVAQLAEMTGLYVLGLQSQREVTASRRLTGTVLRKRNQQVIDGGHYLMTQADLNDDVKKRLKAALLPIDQRQEKQAAAAKSNRAQGATATDQTQAEVARVQALQMLQQVVANLQAGGPIDAKLTAEAFQTYQDLQANLASVTSPSGATPPATAPPATAPAKAKSNRRGAGR